MSPITTSKMSNFRWVICALLFIATTVNYMDRQVLSLTWKDFIAPEFHWTDDHYGTITGLFSIFYAIANLFAGKFVDWMGTKKGYLIAIFVWSTGAVMHAGCGWVAMQMEGYDSIEALRMVQAGSDAAVAIATISVWLFLSCRLILAVGEAGNFPAAIKVTAEYFPKKDRAFSTAIFNSGASVGALAAPATIPLLARSLGWEWAFIIIGVLGYVWMGLWVWLYDKPSKSKHVNKVELTYIEQDEDLEKIEAGKETSQNEGDWKSLHDQAVTDIVVAHSWFRSLSGLDYLSGFDSERILHEYEIALNTSFSANSRNCRNRSGIVIGQVLGCDTSSMQIVNRPPARSKPLYMKVWEARKADGLDYDPDDERQQRYLSEITGYNLTHID